MPAALASIVGLAALFHTSALAFGIVKYLGVAYLLYMAWHILGDDGVLNLEKDDNRQSFFRTALNGFLLNVLNPKLSMFFLAFLPQFVPVAQRASIGLMVYLAAAFMLMTFVVFVVYGGFAAAARNHIIDSPRTMLWLRRIFAGAFGMLGLRLVMAVPMTCRSKPSRTPFPPMKP